MARLQIAALIASLAGLAISVYLTLQHYQGVVPGCPVTGPINCDAVLSSPYAVIGGTAVPTSALGIAWFAFSAVLWAAGWRPLVYLWMAAGLASVTVLVFIEIVRIGAICLWCSSAHVLVLALFLIALTMWQRERAL
jgi:uncharacterized membrane protein